MELFISEPLSSAGGEAVPNKLGQPNRTNSASARFARMQKRKPRHTGPMSMQPVDRSATMPVPLLSPVPGSNDADRLRASLPKAKSTRTDAVRAARARITRRNSLRKQRQAQKG
jgi:hypothetical protein